MWTTNDDDSFYDVGDDNDGHNTLSADCIISTTNLELGIESGNMYSINAHKQ